MCSVQSSLLFLYYVVFSVMSVQYCLCQQDSLYTVFSISLQRRLSSTAFNASSVQSLQHQFLKRSVYRVELQHTQSMVFSVSWVQSTAFMVCLLLFSVGSVQSSIQMSVGFRVCSVQCQCLLHSGCVPFSGSFSVCTPQCLQCSEHWLFNHGGSPEDKIQCKN